jgi:hypothetical protein
LAKERLKTRLAVHRIEPLFETQKQHRIIAPRESALERIERLCVPA